jgi:hypothetical protein
MRTWHRLALRSALVSVAVVGLLLTATASAFADGNGATTFTQHDHNVTETFVPPDPMATNPCSGVPGALQITYNAVFHVTVNKAGDFWATGTQTGDFSFAPVDPTQPSYTGHFTAWFGTSDNNQNGVDHDILNIHGTGSDGSTLAFHQVEHFSVSASGLTVSFDKATCG